MADKQTELDITDKHELILLHGVNKGRRTTLARLDPPGGYTTLYWVTRDLRDLYHKSVAAFLPTQNITIKTNLIEGQHPDVIPKNAPQRPTQHKMQGDLTPAELEWCERYAPVEFENRMGVKLRKLKGSEEAPSNPRDLWVRADVIRIHVQPILATKGGEYLSVKFIARNQIIARRASHMTFTEKEILNETRDLATGEMTQVTAEPYEDRYTPDLLEKMEKNEKIEVVWKRHAAATAGSNF